MKFSKYKILGLQFLLLNQLFIADLYSPKSTFALGKANKPSVDYIQKIPSSSFYILGPGDLLKIIVNESANELKQITSINGEGIANLKRLKRIYASGLTIAELTEILNKEYSVYVNKPDVEITLLEHRPVKVYIDGEVEEPGLHILPGGFGRKNLIEGFQANNNQYREDSKRDIDKIGETVVLSSNLNDISPMNNNILFPTVIDVIRESGGVTVNADLTNIEITRINSITNGSGRIKTKINILETLDLKDTSNNIRILDGDTILVSKSDTPISSQITKAIKSNLNPKFINIYVGGLVEVQGPLTIRKNAVLTEAIAITGGAKTFSGPVSFFRYNDDGTIDKRKFSLRRLSDKGSYKNPYLKDGDVIFIGKSTLNVANEAIQQVTNPITALFGTWGLYKAVFN